jgi:hypothetical protein
MWFSTFVPLLVGVAGNIVIYSCVDVPHYFSPIWRFPPNGKSHQPEKKHALQIKELFTNRLCKKGGSFSGLVH